MGWPRMAYGGTSGSINLTVSVKSLNFLISL